MPQGTICEGIQETACEETAKANAVQKRLCARCEEAMAATGAVCEEAAKRRELVKGGRVQGELPKDGRE